MKTVLIVKLDTPLTLVESAMHVPQAEPVNFATALCDAAESDQQSVNVILLGTSVQTKTIGKSTISVMPYYGDTKAFAQHIQALSDVSVLIWQGRHVIQCPTPSSPFAKENKPCLTEPYSANDFERLQFLKIWQIQCYNLLASKALSGYSMSFVHTDARLPLLELNVIDPIAVPKPLPTGIKLITQAYMHDELRQWMNKHGNGGYYPEMQIKDYCYAFGNGNSSYMPLELLPIISHSKYATPHDFKSKSVALCQIQSLKYMDDFRLKQLKSLVDKLQGKVALMGRFGAAERGRVVEFGKYADRVLENLIGSETYAVPFHEAAKALSEYPESLVITDARYARFGLCPNRLIEAVSVNTRPIIADTVVDNCSEHIQALAKQCNNGDHIDLQPLLNILHESLLAYLDK
jgi:hypothetical protein